MRRRLGLAVAAGLSLLPGPALAQGVVEGTVLDATTGQPLSDVVVRVLGTRLMARTAAQGRYRLTGLAVGAVRLQTVRVGYEAETVAALVTGSGAATVQFRLYPVPVLLDQIVVTASGRSDRQRQSGASVARIVPDSFPPAAIQTFADLITGRTPGLTVLHSGGSTGIGSRVRIRGSNSLALSNEPLYLLDGIRIDNTPTTFSFPFGDESPSRLDEIDQEFVQAVEVVKGPAATALYGTAAANGVIQLQTRDGLAGPARWTTYIEGGGITQAASFPANYGLWTRSLPPPSGQVEVSSGLCTLVDAADGACVPDSVARYNPLVEASPFRTGSRTKVGFSVGGGLPVVTYFVGANAEHEAGVNRTNDLTRRSARANLTAHLGKLEASLLSSYLHRDLGVPQNGFTVFGPIPNGLAGWPFRQSVDLSGHPTYGYDPVGPDQFNRVEYGQCTDHLVGTVTAGWQVRPWLALNGVAGLDDIHQLNRGIVPADSDFLVAVHGLREAAHSRFRVLTANWSATSTVPLAQAMRLTVTGGTQYTAKISREQLSTNASGRTSSTEQGAEQKTVGGFLSAQMGWRDRVFLTGAARADWSGGFEHRFPAIVYPSLMASWVISEEGFFPRGSPLSSLRLRAAYGRSGLLPGSTDPLTLLRRVTVPTGGVEVPTVTIGQLGNPNLRPEQVSELEAGFDAEALGGRFSLQASYYTKRSQDALVLVPLAGSVGGPAVQLRNIGIVRNDGVEVMLTGDPIRTRALDWTLSLGVTGTRNHLVALGGGISTIDLTFQQRLVPGYPLGGFWATPADSAVDRNGDGIFDRSEVFFDPAKPRQYVGSPYPTRSMALMSALSLRGSVRLWTQLEYEGGQRKYDFTERLRCQIGRCRPLNVVDAPTRAKVNATLAYLYEAYRYGYIEDAGFLKWRELGLEWTVPAGLARRAHVRSMLLDIAVRNLATWTPYRGLDPEGSRSQDNFVQTDYYTQPQVRYWVARLTMGL